MSLDKIKVVIVHANDWVGLYKDEKLIAEGHSLSIHHVLTALKIPHVSVACDESWLEYLGRLPKQLKDIHTA